VHGLVSYNDCKYNDRKYSDCKYNDCKYNAAARWVFPTILCGKQRFSSECTAALSSQRTNLCINLDLTLPSICILGTCTQLRVARFPISKVFGSRRYACQILFYSVQRTLPQIQALRAVPKMLQKISSCYVASVLRVPRERLAYVLPREDFGRMFISSFETHIFLKA